MQFKAQLSDMQEALSLASVVKPAAMDSSGSSGYLLVARGDTCFVYSEDEHQRSRISFPITDLDEEGSLVFPVKSVAPLSCLDGEITLQSKEEDGTHIVEYETTGDASQKIPTFDPRVLQAFDTDLENAEEVNTFPSTLLREAVIAAKSFTADLKEAKSKESHKCLQIFDASKPEYEAGNGNLFASSGHRAFYFYCSEFKDKGLVLHGLRIPLLTSFLAKSPGKVTLKRGEKSTYFVNELGQVIGWADAVAEHSKFSYYSPEKDSHILRAGKEALLNSLTFVRKSLDPKKEKVRFVYQHEKSILRFLASDSGAEVTSPPVGVVALDASDSTDKVKIQGGTKSKSEDLGVNINIDWFIELVTQMKNPQVEIRLSPYPKRPNDALIRTIEVFHIDDSGKLHISNPEEDSTEKVYTCQVTRFMPTKG